MKCCSSCDLKVLKAAVMSEVRSDSGSSPGLLTGSSFLIYDPAFLLIRPFSGADGPTPSGEHSECRYEVQEKLHEL